ncbi:hypothetical protein AWZ03_000725 [Drosophila navojoa]|uniref:Uncharacterized protein n=1 Tax=Drosophila navojoa TaxID=7232 RepID=A0A484BZY2_DRONA|nr:hypothetical protein AWZ03_000725 [Drosophila navojoa]
MFIDFIIWSFVLSINFVETTKAAHEIDKTDIYLTKVDSREEHLLQNKVTLLQKKADQLRKQYHLLKSQLKERRNKLAKVSSPNNS